MRKTKKEKNERETKEDEKGKERGDE